MFLFRLDYLSLFTLKGGNSFNYREGNNFNCSEKNSFHLYYTKRKKRKKIIARVKVDSMGS